MNWQGIQLMGKLRILRRSRFDDLRAHEKGGKRRPQPETQRPTLASEARFFEAKTEITGKFTAQQVVLLPFSEQPTHRQYCV